MTIPKPVMARIARNRIQSVFSLVIWVGLPFEPPCVSMRTNQASNRTEQRACGCPHAYAWRFAVDSLLHLLYQAFKFPAPMFEIFELIETRAGGREQHCVSSRRAA